MQNLFTACWLLCFWLYLQTQIVLLLCAQCEATYGYIHAYNHNGNAEKWEELHKRLNDHWMAHPAVSLTVCAVVVLQGSIRHDWEYSSAVRKRLEGLISMRVQPERSSAGPLRHAPAGWSVSVLCMCCAHIQYFLPSVNIVPFSSPGLMIFCHFSKSWPNVDLLLPPVQWPTPQTSVTSWTRICFPPAMSTSVLYRSTSSVARTPVSVGRPASAQHSPTTLTTAADSLSSSTFDRTFPTVVSIQSHIILLLFYFSESFCSYCWSLNWQISSPFILCTADININVCIMYSVHMNVRNCCKCSSWAVYITKCHFNISFAEFLYCLALR